MDSLHRALATKVTESQYRPEIILGIARCGLVSAVHIAYLLGICDVGVVSAKTCESDAVLATKTQVPVVEMITPSILVRDHRVLIVDAVMASGRTLRLAGSAVISRCPAEIRTAIVIDWPNSPYSDDNNRRSVPNYVADTVDRWPVFPWEE